MTIGEKIKKTRTERGLTQKELADTQMTRNMISEIESNKALPSLTNLLYLASKLNVSPAYLIDENMSSSDNKKILYERMLQNFFHAKKYADCIAYADTHLEEMYDSSLAYMLACACLYEAETCSANGNLDKALALLDRCERHMAETDYDSSHLSARAVLCRAMVSDPLTPHYALDESAYTSHVSAAINEELFHYLRGDLNFSYESTIYRAHMEAKQLMREYHYTEAVSVLNHLLERRLTEPISLLIIYRVYADLESCYRERKDYENAYKCAAKKHSLFSSFKS